MHPLDEAVVGQLGDDAEAGDGCEARGNFEAKGDARAVGEAKRAGARRLVDGQHLGVEALHAPPASFLGFRPVRT